ncbi:recombinase family protein [Salinicoccus roseus]|uniref:recombinase family protein n=1 Tax=Salinicoccus roseus TaxID=45670 RepID=UPI001EF6FFAB|nr:recombinase family protein [Salinicoccus roseus]MCG7333556.1 recombinase family protein [Salinicoccus roseus]
MIYGYIRPVELYDDVQAQEVKLKKFTDNIFMEAHADNKDREQLNTVINRLQAKDELLVTDLCILADSTNQLVDIINFCSREFIHIRILNPWIFITPTPRYTFQQVLNEISSFQSDVVKFRTKQGISKATRSGKQIGRPKRNDDNMKQAIDMYLSKEYTLDQIKESTSISRSTLYRHLEG